MSLSFLVTSLTSFYLVLGFLTVLAVWQYCRYTVWQYCGYDGNSTFNQHNQLFPPSGHWNPETLEPRCTGTLEPRDIGTPSAQGGERAPTREPAKGTDPRNVIKSFRYPLGRRRRFVRCLVRGQAAHGGYDVLGRCMLLAGAVFGLFFPRLKGEVRSENSRGVRRPLFKSCHPQGQEVPRPPLWVDSSTALAFIEADVAHGGVTQPPYAALQRMREGRAGVLGTFSARAHGECKVQCGASRPRQMSSANVTLRSAPYTKRT